MKKNVIYLNDWLAIHPYTTVCSSDTFFVELANKLYAACHLEELPEMFCKNLSLYVAAYLEDIISGLGLWQGFTTAHTRLYGRCLPFYPTGKDYIKGEVNLEDVRFIIWNTWQKAPYSHEYVNPLDTSILKQAQAFLPLLEEAYEVAPENELLKDYFDGYADEKEADRKLSWLFGHTYLTEPSMLPYIERVAPDDRFIIPIGPLACSFTNGLSCWLVSRLRAGNRFLVCIRRKRKCRKLFCRRMRRFIVSLPCGLADGRLFISTAMIH